MGQGQRTKGFLCFGEQGWSGPSVGALRGVAWRGALGAGGGGMKGSVGALRRAARGGELARKRRGEQGGCEVEAEGEEALLWVRVIRNVHYDQWG